MEREDSAGMAIPTELRVEAVKCAVMLEPYGKDACLLVELAQGVYTIIVEGDGDPGEVIVEVYEVR